MPTAWPTAWTACSQLPGVAPPLRKPMEALLLVRPCIQPELLAYPWSLEALVFLQLCCGAIQEASLCTKAPCALASDARWFLDQ